jgi:hypothetical protein
LQSGVTGFIKLAMYTERHNCSEKKLSSFVCVAINEQGEVRLYFKRHCYNVVWFIIFTVNGSSTIVFQRLNYGLKNKERTKKHKRIKKHT